MNITNKNLFYLQYWLYEHTTLLESQVKPSFNDPKKTMMPHFLKWDLVKLHRVVLNRGLAMMEVNEVISTVRKHFSS